MAESNATQVILTDDGVKIIKAQTTADNAASGVTNLNDPNLMSVIEKQYNISQFAGLTSQYNVLVQNAKDEGINTTAVTTAYNNLNKFMTDILADPDHASDVDRTTYKKYQDAYNEELANLQSALQKNANNKFTSAASATSQAASTANDAKSAADSAYAYANSEIAVQSNATTKAQSMADNAFSQAQTAIATANSTASGFGPVKQNADSALSTALNAQTDASSAVAKAESTASEFGKVSQKTDSVVSSALSAQSNASYAVAQASSAAADSKDAKQIAGAVSQSYKTLTDGSTMTIAELQSGLAVKLTKADLDGYATQDWSQNQIKTTADGINSNISSIKSTVDGQTTSINDLEADSNGFKDEFTKVNNAIGQHTTDIGALQADSKGFKTQFQTVNDTIGKHTTDIGSLQDTSKKLSSDFSSLSTDNTTNKTNISSLSQTVDGIKTDVSKKLEQKDLNGYATQDWAQNKINVTADGINETISSVKSTVDGHTTSINDLKADSDGFKSQFTTVNDTLGKQATDIGTLQSDAKSLSANFDSLNTDNGTNKHDISQLQQTAKEFNSTLETVQTQVQNSAVGTNLLLNTGDLSTNWSLNGTVDASQNPAVLHYPKMTLTGPSTNTIVNQQLNDGLFKPSTTYTASFYAKGEGTFIFYCYPAVTEGGGDNHTNINLTNEYKLYTITFTTATNISGGKNFLLRQDYSPSNTSQNTVEAYVYGMKLEKGSMATDWCPNPADNATVTALSSLSQTVDGIKTAVSGKADSSQISQLRNDINLRVTKGDLISQINIQAKNTLISSGGQLTLSGKNVYFDTTNPVIIPSANIGTALVNKTLTAANITANTFSTNNGTFTVDPNGAITAKNMTLIGGTLTSPTINASTINGATLNMQTNGLINSPYNGIQQTADQFYHPWKLNTGQLTIGQGYITSVSSGTRSINGVPKQFDSLQGTLSASYLKFTNNYGARTYIDADMFTYSNQTNDTALVTISGSGIGVNMGTKSAPALTIGNGYIDASSSSSYGTFGNITLGYDPHTINSDSSLFFESGHGSGNPGINIWARAFHSLSSRLSTKRQVRLLDDEHSNSLLLGADTASFQYNQATNAETSNESVIIDDINKDKQYSLPDELITRDGKAPTDLMSFIARIISQNKYQARLIEDLQIRLRKVEIKNE